MNDTTNAMLRSHPVVSTMDLTALAECIAACLECAQACTSCADACLAEEMVADLRICIVTDLSCYDI